MQKQRTKNPVIWILLLIAIIAVIAAASIFIWAQTRQAGAGAAQNAQGIVIEDEAQDWDGQMKDLSSGESGIKIPGYGEITVFYGENTWNITLANPEDNSCYFKYTVTIGDDETPIYESGLIEPGKAVRDFEVSELLERGDYEIHLNISTYTMDDALTPMNGAVVKSVLHVV